jgi:hypothetical protein
MTASPIMSETTCPIGYASLGGEENTLFELRKRSYRDGTEVAKLLGERS